MHGTLTKTTQASYGQALHGELPNGFACEHNAVPRAFAPSCSKKPHCTFRVHMLPVELPVRGGWDCISFAPLLLVVLFLPWLQWRAQLGFVQRFRSRPFPKRSGSSCVRDPFDCSVCTHFYVETFAVSRIAVFCSHCAPVAC